MSDSDVSQMESIMSQPQPEEQETIKVITLKEQHPDGDLWFEVADHETPQKLFDFIVNNIDGEVKLVVENIPKKDFESGNLD